MVFSDLSCVEVIRGEGGGGGGGEGQKGEGRGVSSCCEYQSPYP